MSEICNIHQRVCVSCIYFFGNIAFCFTLKIQDSEKICERLFLNDIDTCYYNIITNNHIISDESGYDATKDKETDKTGIDNKTALPLSDITGWAPAADIQPVTKGAPAEDNQQPATAIGTPGDTLATESLQQQRQSADSKPVEKSMDKKLD